MLPFSFFDAFLGKGNAFSRPQAREDSILILFVEKCIFFCRKVCFFVDFFVRYFIDHKIRCVLNDMPVGEMAEWLKASDCKSDDVCLRRFESCSLHHYFVCMSLDV